MGGEDSVVLLAAEQLEQVILELKQLLEARADWEFPSRDDAEDDEP